jgi:type I restriction enzyme, S subunit
MIIPLSRGGWLRVKFGDVVECVNETVVDPQAAGIERVVGLDHLDPGSLHIKRWADIEEGTTFTRRFRSGQVLFGKRRAYQRKLGWAGISSPPTNCPVISTTCWSRRSCGRR